MPSAGARTNPFREPLGDGGRAEDESQFRALVETCLDGLMVVGRGGEILYANAAAGRLLGGTERAGDLLPWPIGEGETIEQVVGGERTIELRAVGTTWEGEQALAVTIRDITRLRAELAQRIDELAEAGRRKDEFLAMLGHELRNPLAAIRNATALLAMPGQPKSVHDDMREVVEQQVSTLARLLDDLLDVSRITTGRIVLRTEWIDLDSVARRGVELLAGMAQTRGVGLGAEPTNDMGASLRVLADPVRLLQAVTNVVHNAVKFTERGGQVRVGARREGEEVVLRVQDTGIGIAPEMLPRVFELFDQADRSLDRPAGGLGIGLTLARRVTELHGGTLEGSSEGLGRGSLFVMRLPAAMRAAEDGGARRGDVAPPARDHDDHHHDDDEEVGAVMMQTTREIEAEGEGPPGRRVLVVDDNVDAARSLTLLLSLWGHEVVAVHDGPEAITAALAQRPEVVLLDIGLPQMDGYEVAYRLRNAPELSGSVRPLIVAMTGYGQDEDRRRSRDAGFDHHMVKPLNLPKLAEIVGDPAGFLSAVEAEEEAGSDGE
jgi:two-component system CheB/CheR fusion protein